MPKFRIKALAKAQGYTADSLARACGLKYGTVRNLWQGRTADPSYSTAKAIAQTLGVAMEELEAREDHEAEGEIP